MKYSYQIKLPIETVKLECFKLLICVKNFISIPQVVMMYYLIERDTSLILSTIQMKVACWNRAQLAVVVVRTVWERLKIRMHVPSLNNSLPSVTRPQSYRPAVRHVLQKPQKCPKSGPHWRTESSTRSRAVSCLRSMGPKWPTDVHHHHHHQKRTTDCQPFDKQSANFCWTLLSMGYIRTCSHWTHH